MMIYWSAFWAWVGVGLLVLALIGDELAGIVHLWGLQPITDDAEAGIKRGDWRLAILIALLGPVFLAWWIVHLINHRIKRDG